MGRKHKPYKECYVIIRIDHFQGAGVQVQDKLTVKKVVTSEEVAKAEVERLNDLNKDKGCVYFYQWSRLFPEDSYLGS